QLYLSTQSTQTTNIIRITHKGDLVDDQGQIGFQDVSIMLSGNTAQPPILPGNCEIFADPDSGTVTLKWASDVGRVYRVQYLDSISDGSNNWQDASSELSATKTNTAVTISTTNALNRFYRVAQVR